MADIAKYRQDIDKFNSSYAKAALKEPINFWGLAGFAVAAAYTGSVIPLLIALICEAIYMIVVPVLPAYRQMVNTREKQRRLKAHIASRESLIKSFTSREREAVEYLRWLKDKIQDNYFKTAAPPSANAASLGKYGDIPVSYHTGVPGISIPIYTVKQGNLSLPVTLSYHSSGIKVDELASWVGLATM